MLAALIILILFSQGAIYFPLEMVKQLELRI